MRLQKSIIDLLYDNVVMHFDYVRSHYIMT